LSRTMRPKPIVVMAIKRAAIYFLCLDFLAFFYYVVGNGQGFVVDTQLMLLRGVSLLSAAAVISSFAGILVAIVLWVRQALEFSILALIGWVACIAVSSAMAVFSSSVRIFSAGM